MHRTSSRVYTFGPYHLSPSEQKFQREGRVIPLTPKVLAILQMLVENAGHLVTRDELIRSVWPDTFVEEGNLSRGISLLRKALSDGTGESRYIETVPKAGYRFIADVTVSFAPDDRPAPTWIQAPVETLDEVTQPESADRAVETSPRGRVRYDIRVALIGLIALAGLSALGYATWRITAGSPPAPGRGAAVTHRQLTFTGTDTSPAISADGRFIAYVSNQPPYRHVTVREVAGGHPMTIATSNDAGMLRWSPDGSHLMFFLRGADRTGFYVAPRAGGSLKEIGRGPHRSCWSPDGKTIATVQPFVGKVRLLDVESGATRLVTLAGRHGWIWDVDWSPDGNRLLIVSQNPQAGFSVLTIQTDGRNQRTIIEDTREIPSARWSPRDDAIYYSRRLDQTASIFKIRLSGNGDGLVGSDAPLVTGLESNGVFEISADGDRLTYAREPYSSNLWLVDTTRGSAAGVLKTRQLTQGTWQVERPSISPNGQSIVFSAGGERFSNLYVLPIAGGSPRQLTYLNAFTAAGVWSPDGREVAFISNEGGPRRVWVTNTSGTSLRAVSTGDVSESLDLMWGRRFLYYQQTGNRDYYVLDPNLGRDETMLWHKDRPMGWVFSPVVSPDGRKIALFWNRKDGRGVWVLDTVTGQKTMILSDEQAEAYPLTWSPDGQRLYLIGGERFAYRGLHAKVGETFKDARVLSIPATGGHVTTVLALPFPEVGGVSMTPDGRRFVCAVYSSRSDVWIVDHFDPDVSRVAAR
jgi:Tol biopolymer transport system component/DNA-binding winged helix-turn-helix (wHTH) protein